MATKTSGNTRNRVVQIAVATSLLSVGCLQLNKQSPQKSEVLIPEPQLVNVISVQSVENVIRSHLSFGSVRPQKSSTLGFAGGGQVADITADVGDTINQGDTIARLKQEELQKQRALVSSEIAASQRNLTNLESNANSANLQQQIAQARQRLARQETQSREIDVELAKGIIQAPYDGIVSELYVHVGDSVGSGRPAVRIVGSGTPTVELNLPPLHAKQLIVGQAVLVLNDGNQLEAVVASKSVELDTISRTQLITCELNNGAGVDWMLGDTVEVRFNMQTSKSGFWLPYSALQRAPNGLWSAFVVVDRNSVEVVERRTLTLELLEGDRALVQGSLADGDQVVVEGLNRIVAGQRVAKVGLSAAREAASSTDRQIAPTLPAIGSGVGE